MNKLFPIHTEALGADYNRQYYISTWEPIPMSTTTFIPFQYVRTSGNYFYVGHVLNGAETDITTKFRSGTELVTGWTGSSVVISASGRNITSYAPDYDNSNAFSNNFTLLQDDRVNFRIDCTLSVDVTSTITMYIRKGSTVLDTLLMKNGKNEMAVKVVTTGTDYNIYFANQNNGTCGFTNATVSCQKCLYDIYSDYVTYYGSSLYSSLTAGMCTFKFQSSTYLYSDYCEVTTATALTKLIKISVYSSINYGSTYYSGGFIQKLYRKGNVRRSPQPKVTVIGDERNGVIVREKVITATKYSVRIRINEEILDALTLSVGATVTITDQTGKVFTCNNMEVDKPDWYGTNGLVTLTFDDNINVFTQNSTL